MKLYRFAQLFRPFQHYEIIDLEDMSLVHTSWFIPGTEKIFQTEYFNHYDITAIQPECEKLVIFVTD